MTIELIPVDQVKPLNHQNLTLTATAVVAEVIRQDVLARQGRFGGTHILPSGPDAARLSVLTEEVGEVAKEINEAFAGNGDKDKLVKELIQVAACAIAWATALEGG